MSLCFLSTLVLKISYFSSVESVFVTDRWDIDQSWPYRSTHLLVGPSWKRWLLLPTATRDTVTFATAFALFFSKSRWTFSPAQNRWEFGRNSSSKFKVVFRILHIRLRSIFPASTACYFFSLYKILWMKCKSSTPSRLYGSPWVLCNESAFCFRAHGFVKLFVLFLIMNLHSESLFCFNILFYLHNCRWNHLCPKNVMVIKLGN
jgi:hypothetical protein